MFSADLPREQANFTGLDSPPIRAQRLLAETTQRLEDSPAQGSRSADGESLDRQSDSTLEEDGVSSASTPSLLSFSDELLLLILQSIEGETDRLISVEDRAYLSVESFKPPPQPSDAAIEAISSFRLVCRRFSCVGAERQFARVTTRFSRKGFTRLESIATHKHLARSVKKFSYMVPWFYSRGRGHVKEVLDGLSRVSGGKLNADHHLQKIREQHLIVDTKEDLRVLKHAIKAFSELQHVQILPVQDYQDNLLLQQMRYRQDLAQHVELKWETACSHSTRTIGEALMEAHSKCSRFSSPSISPQSAMVLAEHPPGVTAGFSDTLETLADRLTCLELHFDGEMDLEARIHDLSPLFRAVFNAARNMQAVHVGFPSHRPVSLPLEEVFHNVRWDRLVAFGVQGWRLDADEVISIAARHKDRLKGLRLRDVLLNEGSMWKDILGYLRDNLTRLDWVSLRRIGYSKTFDARWSGGGVEVPDDPPGGDSEDEDSESDSGYVDANNDIIGDLQMSHRDDYESIGSESGGEEDTDDEQGPAAHEMGFPQLSLDSPVSTARFRREDDLPHLQNKEDLGDNGSDISSSQRRLWERWVVHTTSGRFQG